jgi:hypothetical protein
MAAVGKLQVVQMDTSVATLDDVAGAIWKAAGKRIGLAHNYLALKAWRRNRLDLKSTIRAPVPSERARACRYL